MIYPTKEQLEHDYYNSNMTQQQIAEKYGFKTRQPIGKLFKTYNIVSKSKSEIAKNKNLIKNPIVPKEVIEELYKKTNSISEVARVLNISRNKATIWAKHYDIDITDKEYFFNKQQTLNKCIKFLTE